MALFQNAVVNKYLSEQNKDILESQYALYKNYFLNTTIQHNIIKSKEEEFQEGFLRELFVEILGYTINPEPEYNLKTELKNEKDSKKADGAIVDKGNVLAVIELKSTTTTDFNKIEIQAFNYKNNQKDCSYVITSNFQKLRFYIDNAIEYLEWDLFKLDFENFKLLYLCLSKPNIFNDLPATIKKESLTEEENVTKKLYKEYSNFRKSLFNSIVELNPAIDKLLLFKKTQKLLDRFLFLFFAEDRMLVPPNSVRIILENWTKLKEEMDAYQPLYDRFKLYFGYLNTGHTGKLHDIFAYNGGLFAEDEILDVISIDDSILYDATFGLSRYDYNSEVDVNILGHIFEHSLTEIEELENEITSNNSLTSKTTKRKKDGVFYTPKYITKYMIENTVGLLCKKKKEEFKIEEEDYHPLQKKKALKVLLNNLNNYKEWLLHITILDPACGSGAFLNQALEFLIAEHKWISELEANITGSSIVFDVENSILENNLFGLDINEESIDIAKLSLWLRTARKGRKLNSLNDNIKCGNSLVSDLSIAGDKAFNWVDGFLKIAERGGFDVIVGNPPYVDLKSLNPQIVTYLFKEYKTSNNRINLFSLFIEKSISVLRRDGFFSFIIPSSILTQESYKEIRSLILEEAQINSIVRLPNESFGGGAGEVKVDTIILSFQLEKQESASIKVIVYKGFERINEVNDFNADIILNVSPGIWKENKDFIFSINVNEEITSVIEKIQSNSIPLVQCADFSLGITPYDKYRGHTPEQIENQVFHAKKPKDDTYKKLLAGNDITRYNVSWNGEQWISYGNWLGAARESKFFTSKRILIKQIIDWSSKRIWAALTDEELYNTQNAFNLLAKKEFLPEYLIAVINSKMMTFYHKKSFLEEFKDRFQKILIKDCKQFPIKQIDISNQQNFVPLVETMISKQKSFETFRQTFLSLLESRYSSITLNQKLQNWMVCSFSDFKKELKKQKIEFSLNEESEWLTYFEKEKQQVLGIKNEIDKSDQEIDKMIYRLYELTEDEIKIVEQG